MSVIQSVHINAAIGESQATDLQESSIRLSESALPDESNEKWVSGEGNNEIASLEVLEDYPIGRLKAWTTVLGAFILTFCAGGVPASFGVFQDYYADKWLNDFSPSAISWIGSVQLFLELGVAPLAGKLFDSGHFRIVVAAGSVLISVTYFMLSLTKQNQYYQVFLSQGIGLGLGIGLLYLPAATVVSQHFKKRKALAMGIVSSSVPAGGVVYSIMLNKLIHGSTGFPWGIRYSAFITTGCLLLANFLVFEPKRKRPSSNPALQEVTSVSKPQEAKLWDFSFVLVLICGFLLSFGTYFPVFYVQVYALSHGIDPNLAFYSVAILNASNVFGRIIPNICADKLGSLNIFVTCLILNGVATFGMLACGHPVGLILFALIYGFTLGGTVSLYLPMVASLSNSDSNIGRRMGISLAPVGLAILIGVPISGEALGPDMAWWKGITLASVTMLFSGISLLGITIWYRKKSVVAVT